MSKKSIKRNRLLKAKDFENVLDVFTTDADRIKYVSKNYGHLSIADAFAKFYDVELNESELPAEVNETVNIQIGNCYYGNVVSFERNCIKLSVPGVKDEIVVKEDFADCYDAITNYLLNHNNQLYFLVNDYRHSKYSASVLGAYYQLWIDDVKRMITKEETIDVHIEKLTRGGYICTTPITAINDLTGRNYTSSVFIPGSSIVLNIEHDFEKWVDADVKVVPQKFTTFKRMGTVSESSIIGSRKRYLQLVGNENLYNIYNRSLLESKSSKFAPEVFEGTITGIINSNKKTGVFIELDDKYITGLMPLDPTELLDYKPGDKISVYVSEYETIEDKDTFIIKHNRIVKSNVRCVFAKA